MAFGITPDGRKHILGLWIDPNKGAEFWLMPQRKWTSAMTQFAIMFGDRFSVE